MTLASVFTSDLFLQHILPSIVGFLVGLPIGYFRLIPKLIAAVERRIIASRRRKLRRAFATRQLCWHNLEVCDACNYPKHKYD